MRERRAQLRVDRTADAGDDLGQRLHVSLCRVKVHDAGAQHVAAGDDRVRDERLASALQAIEQLAIQRIQVPLGLGLPACGRTSSGMNRNVVMLRLCVTNSSSAWRRTASAIALRQPDVVANHAAVAGRAHVSQRKPDLERAEAARVL